jgi:hypothetical protein
MVKYDSRYAESIGKWFLNASNAARLFYPFEIADSNQWLPTKKEITRNVIAYEGIRKVDDYRKDALKSISPVALGDGPKWVQGQPEESMFSLYSSSQVGIFGAIIQKTNVEKILQLDCNATDFYAANDFPTYLYYNPYNQEQLVNFTSDNTEKFDLYDALRFQKVAEGIENGHSFTIPSKSALLLVLLPENSSVSRDKNRLLVDNKTVCYIPQPSTKIATK